MTKNLDLAGGTTLTNELSNVSTNYTLPVSDATNNTANFVYNSGTTCNNTNPRPCYSYYSYRVATAGTNPTSGPTTYDICPKGWRLPTNTDYNSLIGLGFSGANYTIPQLFYAVYNGVYNVYPGTSNPTVFNPINPDVVLWVSNSYNDNIAYYFDIQYGSSYAPTVSTINKNFAMGVRCVAKT